MKKLQPFTEKELLKLAKKGTLVKRLDKGTNFSIDTRKIMHKYKKCVGTVPVYTLFKKKITSVYVIYEDFDDTIKYYAYPQ